VLYHNGLVYAFDVNAKKKKAMKFINYLKSIADVDIFPLIGLIIFVLFFAGVSFYAFGASKQAMDEKSHLPLEN
jgi:cbb3-type cytochrome oxidase subunit 3